MGIQFSRLPALPIVDPKSVEQDRDQLFAEAATQIQSDFPSLRFRDRPAQGVAGGGGGAIDVAPAEPPARQLAPFKLGNAVAPPPTPEPEETTGWGRTLLNSGKAGVKMYELLSLGSDLQLQDEVVQDPEKALRRRVYGREGPGPSLESVMLASTKEKFDKVIEAEKKRTPAERTAERDKTLAAIAAVNEEMQGLRPKNAGFWKDATFDAGTSLTFLAPALAAGVATGGTTAPLAIAGLGTYYSSYASHRADGAPPDRAKGLAFADAVTEVATEYLPGEMLFKRSGIFKKALTTIGADIPGEELANAVQSVTAELAKMPENASDEDINKAIKAGASKAWEEKYSTAAVSALSSGTLAGASRIAQAAADRGTRPAPGTPPPPAGTPPPAGGGPPPAAPGAAPPGGRPAPAAPPPAGGKPAPAPAAAAVNPVAPTPPAPGSAASAATATAPAAPAPPALATGDSRMFQPEGMTGGAVVQVQSVDPKTQTAIVARVDEDGEVVVDAEGKPQTFVATFADLGVKPPAPAGAAPAGTPAATPVAGAAPAVTNPVAAAAGVAAGAGAPNPVATGAGAVAGAAPKAIPGGHTVGDKVSITLTGPDGKPVRYDDGVVARGVGPNVAIRFPNGSTQIVSPSIISPHMQDLGAAAPPSATSTEPTSDIAGQLKDMRRNDTPRRGVYVSPDTVAKMKQEGTYDSLIKSGVYEENFDGQGGLLITRAKKDLEAARAARDGGQTDMQAIVGGLTGAGVAKPAGPAVVVERKDEKGAVVQQTAVPPAAAPATAAAMSTLPGTTEVKTPAQALGDRAAQVEAEILGGTPPAAAPAAAPAAPEKPARPKTVLEELDNALAFAMNVASTPKGGTRSVKPDVRELAHAVGTLAQALRKGIAEAQRRGATAEDVKQASDAAKRSEKFTEKTDEDFQRSSGVSQPILTQRLAELADAVASLRQFRDKPVVEQQQSDGKPAPDKPAAGSKGAAAKAVSKGKKTVDTTAYDTAIQEFADKAGVTTVAVRTALVEPGKRAAFISRLPSDMRAPFKSLAESLKDVPKEQLAPKVTRGGKRTVVTAPKPATGHVEADKPAAPAAQTETQKENAAAAKAAPATVPDVNAHAVTPTPPMEIRTETLLPELLGIAPHRLGQEIADDETGGRQALVVDFQRTANREGSWIGQLAAAMSNKFMTPGQRKQFVQLIQNFGKADATEISAARDDLLAFLSSIDGKAMPESVYAAAFDAASMVREYHNEDADALEGLTNVTQFDKGELRKTDGEGNRVDPNLRAREAGEVATARGKGVGIGEVDMGNTFEEQVAAQLAADRAAKGETEARASAPPKRQSRIRKVLERLRPNRQLHENYKALYKALNENNAFRAFLDNAMRMQEQGQNVSSHQVLDLMINEGSKAGVDPDFISFLRHLRDFSPDVPVEFVHRGQGKNSMNQPSNALGLYGGGGWMQIEVSRRDGLEGSRNYSILHTIIHETVHSATVYELRRNPNGQLAHEMELIRRRLIARAEKVYGPIVGDILLWHAKGGKPPKGATKELINSLYALYNSRELAAESLSNPKFASFVKTLYPTQRGVIRQLYTRITRAIGRAMGLPPNSPETQVLNDLMRVNIRLMQAQRARAVRFNVANEAKVRDIAAKFGVSEDIARSILYETMPFEAESPRGTDANDMDQRIWDRLSAGAYAQSPEQLARNLDALRAENANTSLEPRSNRLREHDRLSRITSPRLTRAAGVLKSAMESRAMTRVRDVSKGLQTLDFLVRRGRKWFGSETDVNNPLSQWKNVRDTRRSYANQLMELAERTVNSKWMKLTATQSEQMGDILQQSTQWQIDPTQDTTQTQHINTVSKKTWEAKVKELNAMWAQLNPTQREIYHSTQKYFKTEYARIRKAAIDLASDVSNANLTDQQKQLLYALRNPRGVDNLIGKGMAIDLGDADANDKFTRTVKDLIKISTVKGPYFPLVQRGEYVVEATRRGNIEHDGKTVMYDTRDQAVAAAEQVRALAPKNRARVVKDKASGKFIVRYKAHHVSFHKSKNDARAAGAELQKDGFRLKNNVFTRKLDSIQSTQLGGGLQDLVAKTEQKIEKLTAGGNATQAKEQALLLKQLRSAFVQILAERAASASSQTKREGFAGFKGKDAHEAFARRVRASSWNYANLKTTLAQSKALSRLRKFATNPGEGTGPAGADAQTIANERGDLLHELTSRMQVEEGELEATSSRLQHFLGQLGFANFLGTPSYAIVNSMQNLNVAMPVINGKYGFKGVRALMRGMKVAGGPALLESLRGLVQKPGQVTSYDVYQAIADAVKQDPRFARFATGPNSALQQLVDRNVINATYVQELSSIGTDENQKVARLMEYLRLLPQGAELMNRISTALAVLDVTNGNVDAAADMVDQVHFQYATENRPRFFRKIGGVRVPQSITMFKMYGVATTQLTMSLAYDAAMKSGGRREAATSLAGIIAMHTLFAGITGGVMIEPVRLLMWMWGMLGGGDDDEFSDIDTSVARWATQITGSEAAGRVLAKGAPNLLGFDISDRIGLDRLLMYNAPEGIDEDSMLQTMGGIVAGPMGGELIRRGAKMWDLAAMQGRPLEAVKELLPVKALRDATAGWELLSRGVQTSKGDTLAEPEKFNIADAAGRVLGFRTTEEVKLSDMGTTAYKYNKWRQIRGQQLTNRFWAAYDSGDAEALAEARANIARFNEKNPGSPITSKSLVGSKRGRVTSVQKRLTGGRNPDLQELLSY